MPLSSTPTPTPWEAIGDAIFSGKNCIAIFDTDNASPKRYAANAALAARAVNALEPMREALREALEEIGKRRPNPEVIKRGEAALKLAGDA